jgi:hypothetical protein
MADGIAEVGIAARNRKEWFVRWNVRRLLCDFVGETNPRFAQKP